MTSKVTAKLPLGVAFSMLLISLALFVGCKQEADNSYTPPGYGATVGYLTDTTWKNGNETIKFGAEGSVSVPDSMKKMDIERYGKIFSFELGDFTYDFTYSVSSSITTTVTISAKVTKVPELPAFVQGSPSKEQEVSEGQGESEYGQEDLPKVGDRIKVATCTIGGSSSTKDYYQMVSEVLGEEKTFSMENKPTSGDQFVGTYYDGQGVKQIQIDKDGTFVFFDEGGKSISYWKDNGNGTISVKSEPFTTSSTSETGSSTTPTIYYLYPHALMSGGNAKAYK